MNFKQREEAFIISMAVSLVAGLVLRLIGDFRFKRELLSIIGLVKILLYCGFDSLHLLVMISVTATLVKMNSNPRLVFMYCFAHRIIFASSKYLGLPRNEDNLANALMLTSTLKMITVAYEVDDFRKKVASPSENKPGKKWMQLDHEPSSYDIFCFMTCFVAIFTGPIYRYRTYYDMLHTYVDVPIRSEMRLKLKQLLIVAVPFYITSIYCGHIKNEHFEEDWFIIRLCVMSLVVLRQMIKFATGWLLSEWVCMFVGLGAYPICTKPMPGVGPTEMENGRLPLNEKEFTFNAMTSADLRPFFFGKTTLIMIRSWNKSVQWWMAYFVYSSNVFPRKWKVLRLCNVLCITALWHGIKPGYLIYFFNTPIAQGVEELCEQSLEKRIKWTWLKFTYYVFYYIVYKNFCAAFFHTFFLLQYFGPIARFSQSMHFFGYVIFLLMLLLCGVVELIFPKPPLKHD